MHPFRNFNIKEILSNNSSVDEHNKQLQFDKVKDINTFRSLYQSSFYPSVNVSEQNDRVLEMTNFN